MSAYRPQTARETFDRILEGTDPWVAVGDFVDDWRRSGPDARRDMSGEALAPGGSIHQRRWAAFIAAAVDQLSWESSPRLDPPAWAVDATTVLPEPWFLLPGWQLRMHQLVDTPAAFKRRNIYGGDRILSRA